MKRMKNWNIFMFCWLKIPSTPNCSFNGWFAHIFHHLTFFGGGIWWTTSDPTASSGHYRAAYSSVHSATSTPDVTSSARLHDKLLHLPASTINPRLDEFLLMKTGRYMAHPSLSKQKKKTDWCAWGTVASNGSSSLCSPSSLSFPWLLFEQTVSQWARFTAL